MFGRRPLLCAATLPVGIFDSEAHFGFVAFQVLQLLGVEGSVTFPSVKVAAVVLTASANKNKMTIKKKKSFKVCQQFQRF